jgi:hypothetical protein
VREDEDNTQQLITKNTAPVFCLQFSCVLPFFSCARRDSRRHRPYGHPPASSCHEAAQHVSPQDDEQRRNVSAVDADVTSALPTCSGAKVPLDDTPTGVTSSSEMAAEFATTAASCTAVADRHEYLEFFHPKAKNRLGEA